MIETCTNNSIGKRPDDGVFTPKALANSTAPASNEGPNKVCKIFHEEFSFCVFPLADFSATLLYLTSITVTLAGYQISRTLVNVIE